MLNLIFQNLKKSSDTGYFKNQVEIDKGIVRLWVYMSFIIILIYFDAICFFLNRFLLFVLAIKVYREILKFSKNTGILD